jgi:hypothetical protein
MQRSVYMDCFMETDDCLPPAIAAGVTAATDPKHYPDAHRHV